MSDAATRKSCIISSKPPEPSFRSAGTSQAGSRTNPTIVFFHGNPESWFAWHPQIEADEDDPLIDISRLSCPDDHRVLIESVSLCAQDRLDSSLCLVGLQEAVPGPIGSFAGKEGSGGSLS